MYLGLSPRDISQAMKTDVGGALASFIHEARTAGCEGPIRDPAISSIQFVSFL